MNTSAENSQVLALKYRPKRFEDLIGQETISQTLSLALDTNRLSHAYLFSGLRGSGKTSTARIFAKALMCVTGPGSRPCEVCEHCTMANEGRHIDIIEMDAASSRKIDDIRDLIEHTKYKPASARFKIFIIDEVHMLTKEAFNALLKTLEEPPRFVKFILATTDPLKLPATILSRTQHFRFKNISAFNIVNHLSHIMHLEKIEYENEALEILARSGSGSLRDTLTLLDQAIIFSKNFVDVRTVTDMLGLVDPEFIAAIFTSIFAKDTAAVIAHVRALEDYEAEMVVDELIVYLKERLYQQDGTFSTLILERFFRILSDAKSLFGLNADGSFVLSLLFFKMIEALRIKEVDQMIEELEAQIERPEITMKKAQAPRQESTAQESSPLLTDDETVQQSETPPQAAKSDIGLLYFAKLQNALNDRSAELGKCFGDTISYVSFEEGNLTWESCAEGECKEKLRHGWGVIKHFVKDIFGFETKIKNLSCSKQGEAEVSSDKQGEAEVSSDKQGEAEVSSVKEIPAEPIRMHEEQSSPAIEEPQNSFSPEVHSSMPSVQEMDEQPLQESFSMLEDEIMDGSCVSGCGSENTAALDEASKEIDAAAIMEEPMIKMAQEMFEATKITIQSKV